MSSEVPEPRPASTTILARPGDGPPEFLFVVRPASMRFLPGFHAFPGGALDAADYSDASLALSTLSPEEAEGRMRGDSGAYPALGFFVCAVREIFEEVGVLYAVDQERGSDSPVVALDALELEACRARLLDGGEDFAAIVAGLGLKLATHRFHYRTRWIAPPMMAVPFDARFFVVEAAGETRPESREVDRIDWLSAGQALALAEAGAIRLAPPTMATVSSLLRFDTLDSVLAGDSVGGPPRLIEQLSPKVRRLVAPNPSLMTGPGTNSYLVGDDEIVLIDPGSMEPEHVDALEAAGRIVKIVVTHHHSDHFAGALELSTRTTAKVFVYETFERADLIGLERLRDGEIIRVSGVDLTVLHTPGHASDHICLWFEEEKSLFSGDLVLGEGTTVISPPDGNLSDYLESLAKVARLPVKWLYPAHYNPRDDAKSWIAWYIQHRLQREEEIIAAVGEGASSPMEMVEKVYSAYPPALYPIAERSVLAHLEKLIDEGRVALDGGRYRLLG